MAQKTGKIIGFTGKAVPLFVQELSAPNKARVAAPVRRDPQIF